MQSSFFYQSFRWINCKIRSYITNWTCSNHMFLCGDVLWRFIIIRKSAWYFLSTHWVPGTTLNTRHASAHWSLTATLPITIIISILRKRKLSHQKVQKFNQRCTFSNWESRDSEPGLFYSNVSSEPLSLIPKLETLKISSCLRHLVI